MKTKLTLISFQKKLLITGMTLFFLCVSGLMYQAYLLEEKDVLRSADIQFADRLSGLNSVITQTSDDVLRMQRWVFRYLQESDENPDKSNLVERINNSIQNDYFSLENEKTPFLSETSGNIIGVGTSMNRGAQFDRLINMSAGLFPLQHATHNKLQRIEASFFYSPEFQFGSVFPYLSASEFLDISADGTALDVNKKIHSKLMNLVSKLNNSTRAGFWTEPYLNLKRLGLKVTYGAAIFDKSKFAGIIGADIGLEFLQSFMKPFKNAGGGLILVTHRDSILASSRFVPATEGSIPNLHELLSKEDVSNLRKVYVPDSVERHFFDNDHILVAPIADTQWTFMHILSGSELASHLQPYQIGYSLVVLATLLFLLLGYFFINRDFIKPAIKALEGLEHSRESFRNIVDKNYNGIMILDRSRQVLFNNPAAGELLKTGDEPGFRPEQDLPLTQNKSTEYDFISINGEKRILEIRATETQWEGNGATLAMIQDITERKRAEAMAYLDPLTGIPNRQLFLDRLAHGLTISKRRKLSLAVMFMDLDIFKEINDSHGHDIGDELLKLVAKRLTERVRESDTVARMGGDEFTIIMEGIASRQKPTQVAKSIVEACAEPFKVNGMEFNVSVSIGVSMFPDDGDTTVELSKKADTAMYEVKHSGGNGVRFYSEEFKV